MDTLSAERDDVDSLLVELASLGVSLELEGEMLTIRGRRGALDETLRERIVACKPTIIALLKTQDGGVGISVASAPHERYAPFTLTDIQQAYWIGRTDLAENGSVMCHYYQEFESEGLDLDRLECAFGKVIARHDMLRAVVSADGQQRILEDVPAFRFGGSDMRDRTDEECAATIAEVREKMAYEVFDPGTWPLYNIHAVTCANGRLRLHLSFDLIMVDAESLSKLIWEWKRFYDNPDAQASPLRFSFRDYALAVHADRSSSAYRQSLEYWDARIDELPPAPVLPHPRPGSGTDDRVLRVRHRVKLGAEAWTALKTQAGERGVTPSGLLCAAFAEILGNWSRDSRFTMNLTFCDRRPLHEDVEAQLGDFTTNILLEVDGTPDTFAHRATTLQRQLRRDLDHTRVSGVEVLRRMNRRQHRGIATVPVVFTSLLGHRGDAPNVLFSSNWLGEQVYGISQTPQVSLDYQAYELDGGLLVQWDVVQSDYPDGVAQAMFASHHGLLERMAADSALWDANHVLELPAGQAATRLAVNATETDFENGLLLHDLFVRQAAMRPEAPAVIGADRTLDYATLDRESLILAHELVSRGLEPGCHVAIVMERGWEQVVAALAILRAGGAYLPIDPAVPEARLHHLLENGEVALALTQPALTTRLTWPGNIRVLPVLPAPTGAVKPEAIDARRAPGDLAYTIFTSGSTGAPKGVMIDHRGALNTIQDINTCFRIGPDDRVLALSALNFDLSVYDIFGILGAGGALVMPPPAAGRDPEDWTARIREHGVTVWNTVPQLMRMLVEYHHGDAAERLDTLRVVMMSGDWIPPSLPGQIRELAPHADLYSLGGATEASIWSILHPIEGSTEDLVSIPYGKAMANQSFHVLDSRLNPRPDLVDGELYIGGVGLALGYWRNEDETRYRFVRHPVTGQRLYRTGDLGRALPDGNIELLGRVDFQVKIQGHRIELGEIEHVLKRHPLVREAVVEVRKDKSGQPRLLAFVVPAKEPAPDDLQAMLIRHAKGELPHYMIPSGVISVAELPLSANGKLDRSRLPEPEWNEQPKPAADAPLTPQAVALLEAVRDVLGLEQVDLSDNLLDLGGNSVQVVQINRRLREALDRKLPVAEMFNHASLGSYARHLETDPGTDAAEAADTRGTERRSALARRRSRTNK